MNNKLPPVAAVEAAGRRRCAEPDLEAVPDSRLQEAAPLRAAGKQSLLQTLQLQQECLESLNRELQSVRQQLDEARSRYANLYDFAPMGYLTLDRAGSILDINLRGAAMLGRDRSRLMGVPLAPFLGSGDSRTLAAHLVQVFETGKRVSHELIFKSRGFEAVAVRIESVAITSIEGVTSCHSALIDITELRQAEAALRQEEKRFRTIFEQASVGVALIDSRNGKFDIINRRFAEIIGYLPDEAAEALDFNHVTHPDDRLMDLAKMQQLLTGGIREYTSELRLLHRDGTSVFVELAVSPVWGGGERPDYHIAIIDDVTLRKQAEAVLKCHNEVLELLAGGAGLDDVLSRLAAIAEEINPHLFCAVLLKDGGPHHSRPYVTPGYEVFLSRANLAGGSDTGNDSCGALTGGRWSSVEEILSHHDCATCHRASRKGEPATCCSEPILSGSGEVLGLFTYYYRDGQLPRPADQQFIRGSARLAGIAIERARIEELNRQHHAELAHMARLNMMGEMATGMAHELNQPLSAIATYTDVALRTVRGGDKRPEVLNEALQGAREQSMRASAIISHLRQMVRKQPSQRREVNLNALIRGVASFMQYEAYREGVRISLELDESIPPVVADAVQIEQVVLNLVRNSIDAFRDAVCNCRELSVSTSSDGIGRIEVAVADSGPGISAGLAGRIFESFFTTKGEGGMGLGLSICRSIIEAHGGRLWVESTPGEGAVFFFTLMPFAAEGT